MDFFYRSQASNINKAVWVQRVCRAGETSHAKSQVTIYTY